MQGPATHTFIFADLGGYTALTEAHGDESAADVAANFGATIRALLPPYDAEVIKTVGDAVMLRVPAAGLAVLLARDILIHAGPRHGALTVHAGMHTGPAVKRDGDWFGATVNIAARVAAQAEPGELLMTEATREAAADTLQPLDVRSRGERRLKNVSEPMALYALVSPTENPDETLPLDPVCHMAVDPQQSQRRQVWRDIEYYFCSDHCANTFRAQPETYLHSGTSSGQRPRPREPTP